MLAAKSLPGNPYDGHTLKACIEQATRVTGVAPQEAYADRGYKGHGCNTVKRAAIFEHSLLL